MNHITYNLYYLILWCSKKMSLKIHKIIVSNHIWFYTLLYSVQEHILYTKTYSMYNTLWYDFLYFLYKGVLLSKDLKGTIICQSLMNSYNNSTKKHYLTITSYNISR